MPPGCSGGSGNRADSLGIERRRPSPPRARSPASLRTRARDVGRRPTRSRSKASPPASPRPPPRVARRRSIQNVDVAPPSRAKTHRVSSPPSHHDDRGARRVRARVRARRARGAPPRVRDVPSPLRRPRATPRRVPRRAARPTRRRRHRHLLRRRRDPRARGTRRRRHRCGRRGIQSQRSPGATRSAHVLQPGAAARPREGAPARTRTRTRGVHLRADRQFGAPAAPPRRHDRAPRARARRDFSFPPRTPPFDGRTPARTRRSGNANRTPRRSLRG